MTMHANVNWERVTGELELLGRFQSVTPLDGTAVCCQTVALGAERGPLFVKVPGREALMRTTLNTIT